MSLIQGADGLGFFEGWGRVAAAGTEDGGKDSSLKWPIEMEDCAY